VQSRSYQLGAVLLRLDSRATLFFESHSEPYAQLVLAVRDERPAIVAPGIDEDLVLLSLTCLAKQPEVRLATSRGFLSAFLFEPEVRPRLHANASQYESLFATGSGIGS